MKVKCWEWCVMFEYVGGMFVDIMLVVDDLLFWVVYGDMYGCVLDC